MAILYQSVMLKMEILYLKINVYFVKNVLWQIQVFKWIKCKTLLNNLLFFFRANREEGG